jgi:hypothetical protein
MKLCRRGHRRDSMERAIDLKQRGAASWLGSSRASHLNFSATSPDAEIYAGFLA